jgi:hypothetical protein
VQSPNPRAGSILNAVAASSRTDVWAVGVSGLDYSVPPGFVPRVHSLMEHFDGKRWSVVSGASGLSSRAYLTGVAALPNGEAWAVGSRWHYYTVVEHFDGHHWSAAKVPQIPRATLSGVTAISPDDVWASGSSDFRGIFSLHFDGKTWSLSTPKTLRIPGQRGFLDSAPTAISAVSSSDIWVVGQNLGGRHSSGSHTLTEHFNGSKWTVVTSPDPSVTKSGVLLGVTGLADARAWAVGYIDGTALPTGTKWVGRPLVEGYDGHNWVIESTPRLSGHSYFAELRATANAGPDDVWAVGSRGDYALIEHFNGQSWALVKSPATPKGSISSLAAITAVSSDDLWAVGSGLNGTLVEHCAQVTSSNTRLRQSANLLRVRVPGHNAAVSSDTATGGDLVPDYVGQVAQRTATSMDDPFPTSVSAVLTTRGPAEWLDGAGVDSPQTPVWFVEMSGSFVDKHFFGLGPPPKGTVVDFTIDTTTHEILDLGVSDKLPNLSQLGQVYSVTIP